MDKNRLFFSTEKKVKFFFFLFMVFICCTLHVTPLLAQGKLVAKPAGSTSATWGYYEYLPEDYNKKEKHPVLLFLSGTAEQGNGTTELSRVLKHGPPKLINDGSWPSSRPFIVIAPQSPSGFYNPDKLHDFINLIIKNYRVDDTKIYLTGLSSGGNSVWNYLAIHQDQVAAAIPIAGKGTPATRDSGCAFKNIPLWAFHGSNDDTQSPNASIDPVVFINSCSPKPNPLAKVTIYSGVGHDSWTETYDLSGMSSKIDSNYDPYNISIYDWLLSYTKGGTVSPPANQSPTANTGSDQSIQLPENSATITANCSDPDGNISAYKWEKTSGPSANMSGVSSTKLGVNNMQEGSYEFRLTVTDDDGAQASDQVKVTVKAADSAPPPAPLPSSDCNCDHLITPEKDYINGENLNIQPGDVICIQAGKYRSLNLFNFKGSAQNPITFINCGGQVVIGDPDANYSFVMNNNQYFRLTGTGDPNYQYGIKLGNTHSSGLAISTRSSDYEIDHLEISNTGFAGMHLLTSPKCDPSTWRENFTMRNIAIHDNYVHDTHGEGLYIGHSKYNGHTITCDGKQISVLPHVIKNIKVYNNTIKNTGWDGFQVSCAIENCDIFNNSVTNTGIEGKGTQSAGIVIGGGTAARLYNNTVTNGNGAGIHVFGLGNTKIFNNVVYDVQGDGIFIGEKSTVEGWYFEIINNTIIKTGRDGIRMYNELSRNNKFFNNLILNPASINDYSDESKAYVYFLTRIPPANAQVANNYTNKSIDNAKFVNVGNLDFQLQSSSPAIDKGKDVNSLGIKTDALEVNRPQGGGYDAGAFEFKSGAPSTNQSPVADAGDDVSVSPSTTKVVLNGSGSHDSDGTIASYAWTKTSGPSASLSGATSSQLTVTNLSSGTYTFKLTVKDDDGASGSDEVKVTVSSTPPPPPPTGGNGLTYFYYEGSWNVLPDFSKLKAVKSGQVSNFSLSPRNRNDNFGFSLDGFLYIATAGEYTFYTTSDDGSILYINGKIVVNNDGLHSSQERSGKITLSVGYYAIKVKYFEKTGEEILGVKYAGPGVSKQSIPNSRLYTQIPTEGPPTSSPPPSNEADAVARFYLVNPSTNKRVGELKPGSEVTIGSGINIEAETDPSKVGSIKFLLNGKEYSVENAVPYAMGGDKNGNFSVIKLAPGSHTINAIPYSKSGAKGEAGEALQMKLKIVKGSKVGLSARIGDLAENAFFEKQESGEPQIVSVYPNPIEDKIHIQFSDSEEKGMISCKLFNYVGASYELSLVNAQFSDSELNIDVSEWNLSAGVYLLQVIYNNGLEQKVFRIVKK